MCILGLSVAFCVNTDVDEQSSGGNYSVSSLLPVSTFILFLFYFNFSSSFFMDPLPSDYDGFKTKENKLQRSLMVLKFQVPPCLRVCLNSKVTLFHWFKFKVPKRTTDDNTALCP